MTFWPINCSQGPDSIIFFLFSFILLHMSSLLECKTNLTLSRPKRSIRQCVYLSFTCRRAHSLRP
jgi:hypothetical protein